MKPESVLPPIYLNGEKVSIVEHEKHLGNYVATDIADRNMIANVCDLYQRSNLLISDFRVCDSIDLDSLHKIYCMHMYGSELWNLNCSYVDDFKVAWRKVKRRIWKLPCNTTTSNIGVSIISLHDTPRLHTLKRVIIIFSFRAHIMTVISLL